MSYYYEKRVFEFIDTKQGSQQPQEVPDNTPGKSGRGRYQRLRQTGC